MNRAIFVVTAALLAACAPQPLEGAGMEGRLPTLGRFASDNVQSSLNVSEEGVFYRHDHESIAGWGMIDGMVLGLTAESLESGDTDALDIGYQIGCSGPSMNNFDFDESPQDGEAFIETIDNEEMLVVNLDFGQAGFVRSVTPVVDVVGSEGL